MEKTFILEIHNTNLHGQYWHGEMVKDVVVLVHGMGEHKLRYEKSVITHLVNDGYAVVAFDLYGHGNSDGKRGHAPSYEALLDAVQGLLEKTGVLFPNKNIILYGHSLGGNIVVNYVLRRSPNLKGVILSSPFLRLAFQPPKWKVLMGKILLKLLPSITLPSEVDAKTISRDPYEVERYKIDPLIHNKISPIYVFPVIEAGKWAINNAHKLNINTLVLHGTGDKLIDHNGSVAFCENTKNTKLQLFENGFHELHHDLCKKEFIESVLNWLNKL